MNKLTFFKRYFFLGLMLMPFLTGFSATIFVKSDATGNEDGTSWTHAYTTIIDALASATSGDDVWVAQGVYFASKNDVATDYLSIPDGVELYGGFSGTETMLSQRDVTANETIISGEIGDTGNEIDNTNNLFFIDTKPNGVVIDGFTLQDEYCPACNDGGSIRIDDSGEVFITNCTFRNNKAKLGTVFRANSSGMVYVFNCKFIANQNTTAGGMMYFSSTPGYVVNCLFYDNSATGAAAIFSYQPSSKVHVVNCTIAYNTGTNLSNGGAIAASQSATNYISNSILWGNVLSGADGEIAQVSNYATNASTFIDHCIVQNYSGTGGVTGSNIIAGTNISNEDPLFEGEAEDMLYLLTGSPAIDAGVNDSIPLDVADLDTDGNTSEVVGVDLDGNTRIFSNTQNKVDLGAFESTGSGSEYPLGIYKPAEEFAAYSLFPNPASGTSYVDFTLLNTTHVSVYITDFKGHKVATIVKDQSHGAGTYTYELGSLKAGAYLVSIQTDSGYDTRILRVVD